MFVPEMVKHFHDVKNRDVGVLDPEPVEDLVVGLMSFLEQLNEAGFARTRSALLLLTTRSSGTFLRHSAAPSRSRAMALGGGCHGTLLPSGECMSSGKGEQHVRLSSLPLAGGAGGSGRCLLGALARAARGVSW